MLQIILTVLLFNSFVFAQQNLTTYFEIDQEAVNRILLIDYNRSAVHFSGSYQGFSYDLQLETPEVRFTPGYMHLNATLTAGTSVGSFEWTLTPSIVVDYDVSLDDLRGVITAFDAWVQANLTGAPAWLKDVVIQHYENLELTMYPSKILDYATSLIPGTVDIDVVDIDGFNIEAQEGKLQIGIHISVIGTPPYFTAETYGKTQMKMSSNIDVTIDKVDMVLGLGQLSIFTDNTDRQIPANGSFTYNSSHGYDMTGQGYATRFWRVILKNDHNVFVRIYTCYDFPSGWKTRSINTSIN